MSPLRMLYLALALAGAVWPLWPLVGWLSGNAWSVGQLVSDWRAYADSLYLVASLSRDLIIAGLTLTVWIVAETRVRRNWSALWAIPATFLIGVSCGLPLYLFLRTRPA